MILDSWVNDPWRAIAEPARALSRNISRFPVRSTPFFMAHPEPLAVIGKNTQGGLCFVTKNEQGATKWIGTQRPTAHTEQSINTLTKVDRLHKLRGRSPVRATMNPAFEFIKV